MSTESKESAGPIEEAQAQEAHDGAHDGAHDTHAMNSQEAQQPTTIQAPGQQSLPPPAPPPPERTEPVVSLPGESVLAHEARAEIAALARGEEPPSMPAMPGAAPAQTSQPTQTPLSSAPLVGRSFFRWVWVGVLRYAYRFWTRIAARVFPENSLRAALAMRLGIRLPDRLNLSWVTPHLAVGGRIRPADIARLRKVGVTAVVDTRAEHKDDEAALAKQGIKLLYLPTPDTYPLSVDDLRTGSDWINQQIEDGGRVLVHCEHGVGRSVLLTTAAVVGSGLGAQQALDLVQRKRWQAAPNRRQMARLQEFEQSLREKVKV